GEEVLGIPFTLAVAEQYELVGHVSSVPHHRHYSVTGTTPREPAEDSLPAQQDYFAGALFRAGEPRSGPRAAFRAGGACSHRFLRNSHRQDAHGGGNGDLLGHLSDSGGFDGVHADR